MNVEIANRLVELRKANGLSQESLAEKIGVSRQAVSKWERAQSSPDTDNLIALARLYNTSIDEMLSCSENSDKAVLEKSDTDFANKSTNKNSLIKLIPYPILVTIIYLFIGIVWGLWSPGWLIFLTIPIWGAFVSFRTKK